MGEGRAAPDRPRPSAEDAPGHLDGEAAPRRPTAGAAAPHTGRPSPAGGSPASGSPAARTDRSTRAVHGPYVLLGDGVLRDAVEERLRAGVRREYGGGGPGPAIPQQPGHDRPRARHGSGARRVVVAVSDGWDLGLPARAAAAAAAAKTPFLGVHVELGRVIIGPAVLPGVPGCRECLRARRDAVDEAETGNQGAAVGTRSQDGTRATAQAAAPANSPGNAAGTHDEGSAGAAGHGDRAGADGHGDADGPDGHSNTTGPDGCGNTADADGHGSRAEADGQGNVDGTRNHDDAAWAAGHSSTAGADGHSNTAGTTGPDVRGNTASPDGRRTSVTAVRGNVARARNHDAAGAAGHGHAAPANSRGDTAAPDGRRTSGAAARGSTAGAARAAERHTGGRAALLELHGGRLAEPAGWFTVFAVHAVAAIVAAEARALATGGTARTQGAVVVVELERLVTAVHPFLPDPMCETCAAPARGGPAAAVVEVTARPKASPDVLRATDVAARADGIFRTYCDDFAGVVHRRAERDACGLPVSYAYTALPRFGRADPGIGRATDRASSRLAAVLEAVERRAGALPPGPGAVERAAFADVADRAVDPRTLGMLAPEAYGDPSRPRFTRFDPRVPVDWVWGYSFGRAAPVLVPRDHVYFAPAAADGVPPLVPETSSGCALGGCYEEAAVHALLEVAERDAFLLTWYARMPAPRVALESVRSPAVRLLADRIAHEHGYRVDVFDTSLEHGIPSLALVAVDTAPAPGRPAAMCSAAAHPDPERACWSALTELALFVAHLTARYPAEQDRAAAMVRDPGRVVAMPDHALLHGHPDTLPRWEFLYGGPDGRRSEPRGFAEAFTGRREAYPDLRADLADLTGRYHRAGMEVIVVDQTGPEQRAAGLHAVRAVVPGTLPMTFGHRNRRLHGLPRLRTVPVALGHRTAPLRDDEVNPHPHPFS